MQHIAIEGMDGVGKTTASKLLAKRLGYKFIDKNLRELFDDGDSYDNYIRIRDKVNASPDRLFTAWFYALGNIYLHTAHEKENIVTDRYFLSNYAWSGTENNDEVYDLLVKKLGFPDLTVILYADEHAILSRLRHRDELDSDIKKVTLAKEKYEKMIYFCRGPVLLRTISLGKYSTRVIPSGLSSSSERRLPPSIFRTRISTASRPVCLA